MKELICELRENFYSLCEEIEVLLPTADNEYVIRDLMGTIIDNLTQLTIKINNLEEDSL